MSSNSTCAQCVKHVALLEFYAVLHPKMIEQIVDV